jgi:hypothetical protein
MISKQKKARRAELAAIRKLKCKRHGQRNGACESRDCMKQIRESFYGTRCKKLQHNDVSVPDLDALFYLIKHPQTAENYFMTCEEPGVSEAVSPPVSISPSVIPDPSKDPRKLTLRQRIELAKAA